jgi:hypothetical protein
MIFFFLKAKQHFSLFLRVVFRGTNLFFFVVVVLFFSLPTSSCFKKNAYF